MNRMGTRHFARADTRTHTCFVSGDGNRSGWQSSGHIPHRLKSTKLSPFLTRAVRDFHLSVNPLLTILWFPENSDEAKQDPNPSHQYR